MQIRNVAKSNWKYLVKSGDFQVAVNSSVPVKETILLDSKHVHFIFSQRDSSVCAFSPHYQRSLPAGEYFTIYDQEKDLSAEVTSENGHILYLRMAPSVIHDLLISGDPHMLPNRFEGFGVREYSVKPIGFEADQVIDAFFQKTYSTSLVNVYLKGKVLELISHIFDVPPDHLYEACPFLKEKDNVERIKQARTLLIEKMDDPPSLKELAREIGMNEYNLKIGFKNVYGVPPFKYLQDYKLTYSQYLLREGQLQVSEIAYAIGYKSASHYIEAFRKRFGSTPRKFMSGDFND
ncbi:MAG: helix-turn-helix domain-containing protein [Bacteroidetes bacterium]|nr:helix-turn-helix domain-containing protein [Bacteroidota bacterium]